MYSYYTLYKLGCHIGTLTELSTSVLKLPYCLKWSKKDTEVKQETNVSMGMYNAQHQAAVFETRYEPRQPPLASVTRVDSVPAHVSWLLSSEEKEIRRQTTIQFGWS